MRHSLMVLALPLVLAATGCASTTPEVSPIEHEQPVMGNHPHLRYFGFVGVDSMWDDPLDDSDKTNYLDETAGFTNIAHLSVFDPAASVADRLRAMQAAGVQAVVDTNPLFYEVVDPPIDETGSGGDHRLRPNYRELWDQWVAANPLEELQSAIACFHLADEPGWTGVQHEELMEQIRCIREAYPWARLMLIEAGYVVGEMQVPTEVDWVGFDYYAIPDPYNDPRFREPLRLLKERRSSPHQRLVMVMETQWHPDYAAYGFPPEAMRGVAMNYWRLADEDPDFIAIIGYSWPGGITNPTQRGARNLPEEVQEFYRQVGAEVTGK